MLLEAIDLSKSIGARHLFQHIGFTIAPGEKVALIGRNGNGKTTLLKMLSGEDDDYDGQLNTRKGIRIILTKQEHIHDAEQSPLDYILKSVAHYHKYKKTIEDYESGESTNLDPYLVALEYFTDHNYFNIEGSVLSSLESFGVSNDAAHRPLKNLSGGQKRYVEMTRMMFSGADLLLIDEPTNHMDYLGKQNFINWMRGLKKTIVVVTHDRDVLHHVNKIFELKDHKLSVFKGNYDHYIKHNASQTLTAVKHYSDQLNRLKEAKKRVEWGLQMRAKSKEWKIRYDHWLRDYEKIKAETVKPSFWIDQNSVEAMDKRVVDSYHKFKEKNINIAASSEVQRSGEVLAVRELSLGYKEPVFAHLNFSLSSDQRVFIKGRNGAGKSTLVRTIMALYQQQKTHAQQFDGKIEFGADVRIGEYQQEIADKYLSLPLFDAIRQVHEEKNIVIDDRKIYSLLARYLFNPTLDAKQKIANLSGGQKARFQLIKMFIDDPNLLILDEPTNHLDLPSIEELENALDSFGGCILFISHDTYFINRLGGKVVQL